MKKMVAGTGLDTSDNNKGIFGSVLIVAEQLE